MFERKKERMTQRPPQQVILTVRDPESWYRSAMATIYSHKLPPIKYIVWLIPSLWAHLNMGDAVIWDKIFQNRFLDHDYAVQRCSEWMEEVKRVVPADRLLVFDSSEGWGPLCGFLGLPIPTEPYPRINESEKFQERLRRALMKMVLKEFVLPVTVVAVGVWVARKALL